MTIFLNETAASGWGSRSVRFHDSAFGPECDYIVGISEFLKKREILMKLQFGVFLIVPPLDLSS